MPFSISTNLGSLQAYNALSKVNAATQKAQLQLATQKKINSVADDTSGYATGTKLQAQTMKQQSELSNISDAQNYMSTAESALSQINDKLNQIATKQTDAKDPLKDSASIAKDIKTLAGEINSILKNTNINGTQLLASTDGSTAIASPVFDVGGNSFTADFASSSYLNTSALSAAINQLTGNSTDSTAADQAYTDANNALNTLNTNKNSADQAYTNAQSAYQSLEDTNYATILAWNTAALNYNTVIQSGHTTPGDPIYDSMMVTYNSALDNLNTEQTYFESHIVPAGDLMGTTCSAASTADDYYSSHIDTANALVASTLAAKNAADAAASNPDSAALTFNSSSISANVASALGRLGNLQQTVSSRQEYLTAAVTNNTATISNIFDADVVQQQINSSKDQIASQIATSMLSQMNSAPQNLLTLFR
jgi:flagellin